MSCIDTTALVPSMFYALVIVTLFWFFVFYLPGPHDDDRKGG